MRRVILRGTLPAWVGSVWTTHVRSNERHLRWILRAWVTHYNRGRPHASLGPAIPDSSPTPIRPVPAGHHLPARSQVVLTPILNGLDHEYHLVVRPPHDAESSTRIVFAEHRSRDARSAGGPYPGGRPGALPSRRGALLQNLPLLLGPRDRQLARRPRATAEHQFPSHRRD
jgi:hypothetical protein